MFKINIKKIILSSLTLFVVLSSVSFTTIEVVLAVEVGTWTKLTDDEAYTDNVYGIWDKMVEVDNSIYFFPAAYGGNFLMKYDGSTLYNIYDTETFAGYNSLNRIGNRGNELMITIFNSESELELWGLEGSTWTNYPIPDGIEYIQSIFEGPEDTLFVFTDYNDGEDTFKRSYILEETSWNVINDINDTGELGHIISVFDTQIVDDTMLLLVELDSSEDEFYAFISLDLDNSDGYETWEGLYAIESGVYPYNFTYSESSDKFYLLYSGTEDLMFGSVVSFGSEITEIVTNNFGDQDHRWGKLALDQADNIYIGTTKYNNEKTAELFKFDGENVTQLSSFIGSETEPSYGPRAMVTDLAVLGNELIIGAAEAGEGPYEEMIYKYQLPAFVQDLDGDGIGDLVEDSGPNDGDANNDGKNDSEQSNVSSFLNSVSSKYVSLEVDDSCTVETASALSESENIGTDAGFDYPVGLIDFTVDCGTPGYTTDVAIYFYGTTDTSLIVKKYSETNVSYSLLEDVEVEAITIGDASTVRVSYSITDGGNLDDDGLENGIIVDPVGLAAATVGAPNTGFGGLSR